MDAPCPFDLQPALQGTTLRIRPLVEDDREAMYAAASDPLIWEQHPATTRYQRPVFDQWFADALASRGALAIEERASGAVVGSSRYYEYNEAAREVAVGYTFLIRAHWGGASNAELKLLMLDHAFRWARTVWFHVGSGNTRSQKAMAKIGARFSHEGSILISGTAHAHLFYRIDAAEWPALRAGLIGR